MSAGLLSLDKAIGFAERLRRRHLRVVFTNGVFDLLHPGHVRYLQHARTLGDALIVGVNSDRSARTLEKGPHRPINSERDRAEVLAALSSVNAVVIFDEETPHDIVAALKPDILVKGADWAEGTIVGADLVGSRGGQVIRVALVEGYSTSSLIEKVRRVQ